jgi:hypothetical protein
MVRIPGRWLGVVDSRSIARAAVGGVWLAGALVNALVTYRMDAPYAWLADGSRIEPYRWFFGDVVGANPEFWTAALIVGEAGLGVMTLSRGRWTVWGLAGGAAFSALLVTFATPYTVIMGPYAIFLGWLAQEHLKRNRTLGETAKPVPPSRGRWAGLDQLRP